MMSSIFYGEIKEDRLNMWKENKILMTYLQIITG